MFTTIPKEQLFLFSFSKGLTEINEKKMFSGAESFLFERASKFRKQQTFAEEILWNYLRAKPFGFKFRRQHPFSTYILDFYCHQLKLVIEVDGSIQ